MFDILDIDDDEDEMVFSDNSPRTDDYYYYYYGKGTMSRFVSSHRAFALRKEYDAPVAAVHTMW